MINNCQIHIVNPRTKIPNDVVVVNTTSNSKQPWSKALSPFYLGPVYLWGNFGLLL